MSQVEMAGAPPMPGAWPMYRAMVGIGLLCGLLIVGVYQFTKPVIERNKAEALQAAIFRVLPAATSSATFRLTDGEEFVPLEAGVDGLGLPLVHAGYDDAGALVGFALEGRGMGYADVIVVLYGYSFAQDAIVGLQVLESKETPGLGDRIMTDPAFRENFVALDASLVADGSAIANPIVAVKNGQKQSPWEIDGITGATISTVAIAGLLRESTARWIPRIRRDLEPFRKAD